MKKFNDTTKVATLAALFLVLVISAGFTTDAHGDRTHKQSAALEIEDWNWRIDPTFGYDGTIHVNVVVRNNSSQDFEWVVVEVNTYDANDALVTAGSVMVTNVPAHGTGSGSGYVDYIGGEEQARARIQGAY